MILVDTSVWADHLRAGEPALSRLLESGMAMVHPFVTGEIALGNLRNRHSVIGLLQDLPQATLAAPDEIVPFIERFSLSGLGIGYVDAHLLASAKLTPGAAVWTRDRRLQAAADRLAVAASGLS